MSVMRSKDGNNLVVDCKCGCDNGIRIRVDKNDDIREIVKILGGLGVQHPEYIASVLVNNGIGVKG